MKIPKAYRFDAELLKMITEKAKRERRTTTSVLEEACEKLLEKEKKNVGSREQNGSRF